MFLSLPRLAITSGRGVTSGWRARAAGMVGNALEWYDFAVYGYFASILGRHFFPSHDPAVSIIASFGAFAAGFLARPIGAALFGNVGDRAGRQRVLLVSVLAMAVPTTLIGLLPTYDDIGPVAPVLLVILRLCQGLSVGGEMTGSITFMIEGAPEGRRGVAGSFSYLGLGVGCLMGAAAGSLVTGLLSAPAVDAWGWRLPFLFGSVIGVCGFLVRRYGLTEAYRPADEGSTERGTPLRRAVAVLIALLISDNFAALIGMRGGLSCAHSLRSTFLADVGLNLP